jgi:D-alanyl-D-alanine-carboxypeptidase/D-alanyl-D-alanine-endopeptidase
MSLQRKLALALASMGLLAAAAAAQTIQAQPLLSPEELRHKADALAQQIIGKDKDSGLVLGLIYQGQPMKFTYGETRRGKGVPPNSRTEFEIGSLTKTFTAALLALYLDRGLVKLDDPVQKYMPHDVRIPTYKLQPITLLDLATHTSGLPRTMPMHGSHLQISDMYNFLTTYKLTTAPGSSFEYSNLGVALLANVLENVGHDDWQSLVAKEITKPLGLADTQVELYREQKKRLAQGYNEEQVAVPENVHSFPAFLGSGGLHSTLDDMMKYLAFNMGTVQTPLNSIRDGLLQVRRQASTPGTGIALIWQTVPLAPGSRSTVVNKNGSTPGFYTYLGFVPQTKAAVVMMGNGPVHLNRYGIQLLRFMNRITESESAPVIEDAGTSEK